MKCFTANGTSSTSVDTMIEREDPGNECEITFNRLAVETFCGMKGRDKWLRNLQTTRRWRNENGSRVFRHASQSEEHFFQHSLRYSVLGEEKNFFNRETRAVHVSNLICQDKHQPSWSVLCRRSQFLLVLSRREQTKTSLHNSSRAQ